MDDDQKEDGQYSDEETARRRDEVIKRMINTPPQPHKPHKPLGKPKPKAAASPKKRGLQAKVANKDAAT